MQGEAVTHKKFSITGVAPGWEYEIVAMLVLGVFLLLAWNLVVNRKPPR